MEKGVIQIYYGEGHGKSTAAIGNAIHLASEGKSVIVIQFLKEKNENELMFLNRLEPEIKVFRFAKSDECFEELPESARQEEVMNLRNGFNYGKKVVSTGACDMLILDEVLGIMDEKVISPEELRDLFAAKPEEMTLVCTGRVLDDSIREYADEYPFLDYYEVLQKLSDIAGRDNMIVRRFEEAKKVDGGILADFLSQIGLELTDEYVIEGGDIRNTSLTGNTVHIKKAINELGFLTDDDNAILRESLSICTGPSRKEYPCSEFSPEERAAFMKAFEESNARIADEFIGDGRPLFSTDYKENVKWEDNNPFLINDVVRASASADVLLDRQIREMRAGFEARIAELESRVASLESSLSKLEAATDKRFQKVDRRLEKHDVRIDHLRHPLQALKDRSK